MWQKNRFFGSYAAEMISLISRSLILLSNDPGKVDIENTSWKVLAYGIYARVVDVSEIERVSAANE